MTKTILLAEDSADDEFFFRRVYGAVGLTNPLQVVRDGQQVISYLSGEGDYSDREKYPLPGVLFLDVRMPRVNGREVLEWLKTQPQFKKLLLVMITTQTETNRLENLYALGANTFLSKPFSVEDFQNLMRSFEGHWMRSDGAAERPS